MFAKRSLADASAADASATAPDEPKRSTIGKPEPFDLQQHLPVYGALSITGNDYDASRFLRATGDNDDMELIWLALHLEVPHKYIVQFKKDKLEYDPDKLRCKTFGPIDPKYHRFAMAYMDHECAKHSNYWLISREDIVAACERNWDSLSAEVKAAVEKLCKQ